MEYKKKPGARLDAFKKKVTEKKTKAKKLTKKQVAVRGMI